MPTLQATAAIAWLPTGAADEQSADGLGDRGERLVLGELAQPGRQGGGGDEAAAEERQQGEEHRGVAGRLDALGGQAERDGEPDEGEGEQRQHADGGEPLERAGVATGTRWPRATPTTSTRTAEGLEHAAEHVAGEHRAPGDGHGAEPVDDALGHVHGDGDGGAEGGGGHGHEQDAGHDVGEVGAAAAVPTPCPPPGRRRAGRRRRRRTAAGTRSGCRRASAVSDG